MQNEHTIKTTCSQLCLTVTVPGYLMQPMYADHAAIRSECTPPYSLHLLPRVLIEIHAITPTALILVELKIICTQPKRLENAIPELLQLSHHIRHLRILGLLEFLGEFLERRNHSLHVQARQLVRWLRERLVVLQRALQGRPAADFVAGFCTAEERFGAQLVHVVYGVRCPRERIEEDFGAVVDFTDDAAAADLACSELFSGVWGGFNRGWVEPVESVESFCRGLDGLFPLAEFEVACGDVGPEDSNVVFEVVWADSEGFFIALDCAGVGAGSEGFVGGRFFGVGVVEELLFFIWWEDFRGGERGCFGLGGLVHVGGCHG
jgi:hypothetical protein